MMPCRRTQPSSTASGTTPFFPLQIENLLWDPSPSNHPPGTTNVFAGFRGPVFGDPSCPGGNADPIVECLFAQSPGFDMEFQQGVGVQITGIAGGVFGGADVPFVDFGLVGGPG